MYFSYSIRRSDQKSKRISLVSGVKYYVEGVMREGTSGDDLAIGAYLPDGTTALPITSHYLQEYH